MLTDASTAMLGLDQDDMTAWVNCAVGQRSRVQTLFQMTTAVGHIGRWWLVVELLQWTSE